VRLVPARGGNDGSSADAASLESQPWVLVSGIAVPQDAAIVWPSATFENGTLAGSTGCCRYTASYTVDGDSLEIGQIASTRMACPPPADAIEQAYLAALGQVTGWRSEMDTLVLVGAAGSRLLRYVPATPVGNWQVTGSLPATR
jgi:heat shock protein HslJ